MKNTRFLPFLLIITLLTSCLDTEEKIVLNADYSGTYTMSIDMGKVLSMVAAMGGDKTDSLKLKQKKDTTIYLKDIMGKTDSLSEAEKDLFKNAELNIKIDEANNEMKIVMHSPFSNPADLMALKKNFGAVLKKLKALDKAGGDEAKDNEESGDIKMDAKSVNPVEDQFTFKASPGFISNSITNLAAFKEKVATDSSLASMSQVTAMMGDFNFRTVIVLPRAVKKYDGPGSSITTDKRTITFETNLTEMMAHPEKIGYKVEY